MSATLRRCAGALILVLTVPIPGLCQQSPAAGRIKVVSGAAFVVRQSAPIPARIGDVVFEADGLRTGADGRIGFTLKDDTRVSLGPNSEVRLDRFVYSPGEGRLAFALMVLRGIATYVSGRIAKLSPDSVHLETPRAIIGVRGTRLAIRVDTQ
jgi:hypothetical protein